ncbi:uncharacterized protein [Montipora capricornis]|uniref:uncharacterized protein n=1 Tax=Montipora capricornis TaxID=246305 RepID=UPI0035F18FAD
MATSAIQRVTNRCRFLLCSTASKFGKPYTFARIKPVPPRVGIRPVVVLHQVNSRRGTATISGSEEQETMGSWLEKARKRSWLWRWLNDIHEIEAQMMSEEEYNEREKMVEKLMDRYFDTPDAKFDHDIFEEIFDLMIKYNDREAVKMFWGLMQEMQVQPSPVLREKVEKYLIKAREESWSWF